MRNWDSIANNDILGNPSLNLSKCSQELDFDDAKKTAEELNIKIMRVDFIKALADSETVVFVTGTDAARISASWHVCGSA